MYKTKTITAEEAIQLLMTDVSISDLDKDENKWIMHSLYVGEAAGKIARQLGMSKENVDYAKAVGYLHDIGRKKEHSNHVIEGYEYLLKLNHPDVARYCLTHSFIDNQIYNTAGGGPRTKEKYDYINNKLKCFNVNVYDNIVQLCDLFCKSDGFTTFEKRIIDITERKGVYPNSLDHFNCVMELKDRIEKLIGMEIYDLFNIKKEDLDSQKEDYEQLITMFNGKSK